MNTDIVANPPATVIPRSEQGASRVCPNCGSGVALAERVFYIGGQGWTTFTVCADRPRCSARAVLRAYQRGELERHIAIARLGAALAVAADDEAVTMILGWLRGIGGEIGSELGRTAAA